MTDTLLARLRREQNDLGGTLLSMDETRQIVAALEVVQPVAPDREVLAKALAKAKYGAVAEWEVLAEHFQRAMLEQADALRASGVLGRVEEER